MDTTTESDNEISQPVFQENAAPQPSNLSRSIFVSPTNDDLSNDAAIPPPTISLHVVPPDPDSPQDSSLSSPQSVSRMDTSILSLIEPITQASSSVIRRLVTGLPIDYRITECRRSYQALLQPNPFQTSQFHLFMRAAQARNLRTWSWTQAMKIHGLSVTLKMRRP